MITQAEVDVLLKILKRIKSDKNFTFPEPGDARQIEVVSDESKQVFIVDVNRKGYVNLLKRITYQSRFQKDVVLLRLDINGPDHTNPDGEILSGDHIHIYQDGHGDKWAYTLPPEICHPDDIYQTLIDFLEYFKVEDAKELSIQTVM